MPRTRVVRPHGFTRGGQRRRTEWISATVNYTDFTASASQPLIEFANVVLRDFVPCTIVRTVGLLSVAADVNFITNQALSGAVGACLVRDDARATGVFPDPFVEAGQDVWFYHQFFAMLIDDRADSDIRVSQRYMIDSRAQRKVVDGDSIAFIGEGGGETDGFDLALFVRLLLKLH